MSDADKGNEAKVAKQRFELKICGPRVQIAFPLSCEGAGPTEAEVLAALNELPVDAILTAALSTAIRDALPEPVTVGEIHFAPGTTWAVKVSPSRLAVYAIPSDVHSDSKVPDAPLVSEADVRAQLAALQVSHGLDEDVVRGFAAGTALDSAVLLARGAPAAAGHDASIVFSADASGESAPSDPGGRIVDYHAWIVHRVVQEGEVLAHREAPVPGKNGRDVLGRELAAPAVKDKSLAKHQGKGTRVEGNELIATVAGRPVLKDEKISVLAVYDVPGNVDFSVGNIDFPGDVVIHGDVEPGFAIRAGGSVTVEGIVDRATIHARGDIVARGVTGDTHCNLETGRDVSSHYLHNIHLVAEGTVRVEREILNCSIEAARVETPAAGRIVGGRIVARGEVSTGSIGSPQGTATHIEVGSMNEGERGVVRGFKRVSPGTVVVVGRARMNVGGELPATSFWESGDEVVCLDAGSAGPEDTGDEEESEEA